LRAGTADGKNGVDFDVRSVTSRSGRMAKRKKRKAAKKKGRKKKGRRKARR
jgi:hypothetical protein